MKPIEHPGVQALLKRLGELQQEEARIAAEKASVLKAYRDALNSIAPDVGLDAVLEGLKKLR